jgi:hypothetical protein
VILAVTGEMECCDVQAANKGTVLIKTPGMYFLRKNLGAP